MDSAPKKICRVAMWSGPRNISTALMRSFENRPDCSVVDEPFYAYYLNKTGIVHPGGEAVLASQSHEANDVIEQLISPPSSDVQVQYQKLMSHHITANTPLEWTSSVQNCFLLRDPRAMIASYVKQRTNPTLEDLGFRQLAEIFDYVSQNQTAPPIVIDSDNVLQDPRAALTGLCSRLNIPFDQAMLTWPSGSRASDGAWAPWWYANVEKSTGFEKRSAFDGNLPKHLEVIAQQAMPYYQRLFEHRVI